MGTKTWNWRWKNQAVRARDRVAKFGPATRCETRLRGASSLSAPSSRERGFCYQIDLRPLPALGIYVDRRTAKIKHRQSLLLIPYCKRTIPRHIVIFTIPNNIAIFCDIYTMPYNNRTTDLHHTTLYRTKLPHHTIRNICLLYTSPSPRDKRQSRMPSSA